MQQEIKRRLNSIEQMAYQIMRDVQGIYGYCEGMESVANEFSPASSPQSQLNTLFLGNGFDNPPIKSLSEVIKEMIVELKIKGSVRERANGLIELRTQALGSIYGRTKEEIETKLTKALKEAKKKKGTTNKQNTAPLLSEFFYAEYLPYKKNQHRAAKTLEGYYSSFNYIKKAKFDKPVTTYTSKEIEDFLYSIPYSRTRQVCQGFLNNIFKRLAVKNLIKSNPCDKIEKVEHKQEKGTAFSFAEQKEFFNNLFLSTKLTYCEKCYYAFVYLTGTRKEEAINLNVEDVNFENKFLHISGTKTEGSDRKIPLTPLAEKLLLSLNRETGKYFNLNTYSADKVFRKVWKKEKGHKLHDLRHTYGSIKISVDKLDIKSVSLLLGHATVNTTLKIYTHPEQLDPELFFRGDVTEDEKLAIRRRKSQEIICLIEQFLK